MFVARLALTRGGEEGGSEGSIGVGGWAVDWGGAEK